VRSRTEKPAPLRARAIRMLARREYSRAELARRLTTASVAPEDVTSLLDDLERLGYLSDARYADAVVTRKAHEFSHRGIAQSLRARGVDRDTASAALDARTIDDHAALIALWRRRFGQKPVDDREKARQVRFLQSRGFALSAILALLRSPPDDADDQGP
jgi:regulatory protein